MTAQPVLGRRERKKAQTRATISDVATRLFLERGYDQVSIKEIADTADVAVTTVFKHFTGKEALIFDEDAEIEQALVAAVRDRAPGTSILDALRDHLLSMAAFAGTDDPRFPAFVELVTTTPALAEYGRRMWMRHEAALAAAIAEATGKAADDIAVVALAHFVLEARSVAHLRADRSAALTEIFALLSTGWGAA